MELHFLTLSSNCGFSSLCTYSEEIAKSHIYLFLITLKWEDPIIGKHCNDSFVTYLAVANYKEYEQLDDT